MTRSQVAAIVFTDLVSSTALRVRLGDDAFDDVRRAHDGILADAVARHDGAVVKGGGDGIMAAFASASDAVGCAVAIQQEIVRSNRRREPLGVRVGIAAGDVAVEDDDYHGTPVVEAARLCAAAEGGVILCSDLVRLLAGSRGDHEFELIGALELRGLTEPVPTCSVRWTAPDDSVVALPASLSEPDRPLVGREAERATVAAVWVEVRGGARRAVVLAGEAGVGKTRLATEIARDAHREGAIVLMGRADESLRAPFRPWIEAMRHLIASIPPAEFRAWSGPGVGELARILPEIRDRLPGLDPPSGGDPDTERYALFEAVAAALAGAAATAPVVLVLEDLHWADAASLLLLRHVLRGSGPAPLMVLATVRDAELDTRHPLTDALADLRRDNLVTRVTIDGLDRTATSALVTSWADSASPDHLVSAIYAETEGNPFFVQEVLRHLLESGAIETGPDGLITTGASLADVGIPEGVREVVRHRLARLPSPTQSALTTAALVGREFDLEVLAAASDAKEDELLDALDEAVAARVIQEVPGAGGRYRFAHALIRATLADSITVGRRARFHLRIGAAIEERDPDDVEALAHHYEVAAAGGAAKAVQYAERAARDALAQLAYEDGIRHAQRGLRALDLVQPPDDVRRCELLLLLAEAHTDLQEANAAHEAAAAAADLARRLGSTDHIVRAAHLYCGSGGISEDPIHFRLLDDALSRLDERDSADRAILLANRAAWQAVTNPAGGDLEAAADATSMARRLGDPTAIWETTLAYADSLVGLGRAAERVALVAEGLAAAERVGVGRRALNSLQWRTPALLELGDRPGAEASIDDCERRARRLRHEDTLFNVGSRSLLAMIEGRLDDADRMGAEAAASVSAEDPTAGLAIFAQRLGIARERGHYGELLSQIEMIATLPEFPGVKAEVAYAHLGLARHDEARAVLDEFRSTDFATVPRNWGRPSALQDLVELATAFGDTAAATALLHLLTPYRAQILVAYGAASCRGAADRAAALLLLTLGRTDEAIVALASARKLEQRVGGRALLARTGLWEARALLARDAPGDEHRARDLLTQVSAEASAMGMVGLAAEATRG